MFQKYRPQYYAQRVAQYAATHLSLEISTEEHRKADTLEKQNPASLFTTSSDIDNGTEEIEACSDTPISHRDQKDTQKFLYHKAVS